MTRREWLEVEASWRDDVEGVIVIEAVLPEAAQTIRRRTRGLTVLLFETFELSQSRTEKFRKSFIPLLSRKFPIGFMNFNSCLLIYIIFFIILYNPANAAILNKPFIHLHSSSTPQRFVQCSNTHAQSGTRASLSHRQRRLNHYNKERWK